MAIETIIISAVASIGLKLLANSLDKGQVQKAGETSIPDSDYRQAIPRSYNQYRHKVIWVEPNHEKDIFEKKVKNKVERVYIKQLLGVLVQQQTVPVNLIVNGTGIWNEPHPEYIAPNPNNVAVGKNWVDENVTWLDGSYDQQPWQPGVLTTANRDLASALTAELGISSFDINSAIAYRGVSCIGLKNTEISENFKTNTLLDIEIWHRSKQVYDLADIVIDICQEVDISTDQIDVSELVGQQVVGFSIPQNGEDRITSLADLAFVFKFLLAEDPNGIQVFRKLERPDVTLSLDWRDFVPFENGRLWIEEIETETTELPKTVSISYIDPALHFLENIIESDEYPEAKNQHQETVTTRVAMFEADAKQLANWHLNQLWIRNKVYRFQLYLKHLGQFIKGDVVELHPGFYVQIESYKIGADYVIEVQAVRYDLEATTTTATVGNTSLTLSSGSSESAVQPPSSYTPEGEIIYGSLYLLDVPAADETHSELGIYCFSDRPNSTLYLDRGTGEREELTFSAVGVFGDCLTVLPVLNNTNLLLANLPILEEITPLEVSLTSGTLDPEISDTAFSEQKRIAFVGRYQNGQWLGEYIGFQLATEASSGRYLLQNLQRGLRGTEWFIDKHIAGEKFFLILGDEAYWERILVTQSQIGQTFVGKLEVVPDQNLTITPSVSCVVIGQSIYPYPPTDISFIQNPQGNLVFSLLSRKRGRDRTLGENSDRFEIDLLNNTGTVIRTISGSQPLVYPQVQLALDGLDLNALDLNIYKISSIVGRGHGGIVRDLASGGSSSIIVTNPEKETKGFKFVTTDHTISEADDGYWILVNTNVADVNIVLPAINSVSFYLQNIGSNKVKFLGNLTAISEELLTTESIYLANLNTAWYGHASKISTTVGEPPVEVVNNLPPSDDLSYYQTVTGRINPLRSSQDISYYQKVTGRINPLRSSQDIGYYQTVTGRINPPIQLGSQDLSYYQTVTGRINPPIQLGSQDLSYYQTVTGRINPPIQLGSQDLSYYQTVTSRISIPFKVGSQDLSYYQTVTGKINPT